MRLYRVNIVDPDIIWAPSPKFSKAIFKLIFDGLLEFKFSEYYSY